MTNTLKIFKDGKLVEVVYRPAKPFVPAGRKYTPRNRMATRTRRVHGKWGSNQYVTKPLHMAEWKRSLIIGGVAILAIALCFRGLKVWLNSEEVIVLPAKAAEVKLISPLADEPSPSPKPTVKPTATPVPTLAPEAVKEERIKKTHTYLKEHNSPLAEQADYIVAMADQYDIPWTLVTAIAQKESSLCKYTAGANNCWGITTGKKTGPRFASYPTLKDGIEAATKLLASNYRTSMNKAIQQKYCPDFECSNTWVEDVTSYQKAINN